ncbi:uncharacterized protein LOC108113858 [Drosophila eugracilis]|uniref:uncharacterized protein LOC108113858 n=1 Tax=Drosophila eugracilis TaxID=29029 RepID=UPI0007E6C48D|nr:uncharacterized protein LOC108113858 [Drosophila eugracilis]
MKSLVLLLLVILCLVGMAPAQRKKRDLEIWIRPDQNPKNNQVIGLGKPICYPYCFQ